MFSSESADRFFFDRKCRNIKVIEENINIKVERVTGFKNMTLYGIYLTPAVVIDREVKCDGRLPTKKKVRSWVKEKIKKIA